MLKVDYCVVRGRIDGQRVGSVDIGRASEDFTTGGRFAIMEATVRVKSRRGGGEWVYFVIVYTQDRRLPMNEGLAAVTNVKWRGEVMVYRCGRKDNRLVHMRGGDVQLVRCAVTR